MARILIASVPLAAHLAPLLPVARALIGRGHEVSWLGSALHRARIEATGASFVPYRDARDYDEGRLDEAFPGRAGRTGLMRLRFDLGRRYVAPMLDQLRDVARCTEACGIDLVIGDPAYLGAQLHHERTAMPLVVLNGSLLTSARSATHTPFSLPLAPAPTRSGKRIRARAARHGLQRVLLRDVRDAYRGLRAQAGLSATGWLTDVHERATLVLQPSVPPLEGAQLALPENVRFIGLLPVEPPEPATNLSWLDEVARGRPVVYVTAPGRADLLAAALRGLAREEVLMLIATGEPTATLRGLGALPDNVRVASSLPEQALISRVRVMVTDGDFWRVQRALSHGVPLALAPADEGAELAARVARTGAALDLRPGQPSPVALRGAVRRLLRDPFHRECARSLGAAYTRFDALAFTLSYVERLVGAPSSVLRKAAPRTSVAVAESRG